MSIPSGQCGDPFTTWYSTWYERSFAFPVCVTRERSSRNVRISAPTTSLSALNCTRTYRPKRDEFLFRVVFALPKASRIGLVSRILSVSDSLVAASEPARARAGGCGVSGAGGRAAAAARAQTHRAR